MRLLQAKALAMTAVFFRHREGPPPPEADGSAETKQSFPLYIVIAIRPAGGEAI